MIAKVLCLIAAIAVASAGYVGPHGGHSVGSRRQDDHGNYAFNYQIVDHLGATNGRAEVGDGYGNKKGSYNIADIDGRVRRVDYVADGHGFRAAIKTNEPGTKTSLAAAATYNTPFAGYPSVGYGHGPAVVAKAVAPVAVAPVAVAPVATVGKAVFAAGPALGYGGYGHGYGGYGGYGRGPYGYGGYGGYGYGGGYGHY